MSEEKPIRGERATGLRKPTTYEPDRVCAEEGCETVLSVYNKQTLCWTHLPKKVPVTPRKRKGSI